MLLLSTSLLAQAVPAKSSEETTRGVRNNNPGNIVLTPREWIGEVECSDPKFKCFESPRRGLEAIIRNLEAYYFKYNIRTLDETIERWSPRNENQTDRLTRRIHRVFDRAGVGLFSFSSRLHLTILIRELIKQENSIVPYTDRYILEVLNDTSRITDNGDEYIGRWSHEALVSVYREQETAELSSVSSHETEGEVSTGSPAGQEPTVHQKNHSSILSRSYHSLTENSRTLRGTCNLWMDRVAERVLALHGWRGYSPVASSDRRDRTDTSRYSFSFGYCWTLFWRQPYLK